MWPQAEPNGSTRGINSEVRWKMEKSKEHARKKWKKTILGWVLKNVNFGVENLIRAIPSNPYGKYENLFLSISKDTHACIHTQGRMDKWE